MYRLNIFSPIAGACVFLAIPAAAQQAAPAAPIPTALPAVFTEPETTSPEVTLDELIGRALRDNPVLAGARARTEATRLRLSAARAPGNPVLLITPGFGGTREARDEEIILSQPIDVFGRRRARAGVAGAEVRRADAEALAVERSLTIAVKQAGINLFAAQEAESLGVAQVDIAQKFRDAAARRAELGDVPAVQTQRAELELLRAQNDLTVAQATRAVRQAELNGLIGQSPQAALRVGLGALYSEAEGQEDVALRAQFAPGLAARPDIAGAQAALQVRRAQAEALKRERLPLVELQARRSAVTASGSTAVRAVISIPLFDFGSNKRERRALEAEARGQEAQIAQLRIQAAAQVEAALIRVRERRQTAARYRTGIVPLTLELLRKTQVGYAQGASTYLEVLDAQRTMRGVQNEYLQALIGARTAEVQLENALGVGPLREGASFGFTVQDSPTTGVSAQGDR